MTARGGIYGNLHGDGHEVSPPRPNKTEQAVEAFCKEPAIIAAMAQSSLAVALVKVAFMEGAKYATGRCKAAGHH